VYYFLTTFLKYKGKNATKIQIHNPVKKESNNAVKDYFWMVALQGNGRLFKFSQISQH
jgi:hypothetical protein